MYTNFDTKMYKKAHMTVNHEERIETKGPRLLNLLWAVAVADVFILLLSIFIAPKPLIIVLTNGLGLLYLLWTRASRVSVAVALAT